MRPAENIEKLIKNAKIDTNAKMDQAVLDDILKALEKSKTKKSTAPQQNIWRTIMKSKITKFAAAAVVIVATLVGARQIADWHSTDTLPAQDQSRNTFTTSDDHSVGAQHTVPGVKASRPGVDKLVARATLIIRGKYLEKIATWQESHSKEDTWNVEVIRVLYGNLHGNIITAVDSSPADWPDPDPGEHILYLRPSDDGQLHILAGVTPFGDLDAVEQEIREVIESGAHLSATYDSQKR